MTDEYNGWTNRETWALNLWLSNDQGLYEMTRERVQTALASADTYHEGRELDATYRASIAGEAVKDFVDELTDPDESLMDSAQIVAFLSDVGSLYRVNWDEIGRAWLDDFNDDGSQGGE